MWDMTLRILTIIGILLLVLLGLVLLAVLVFLFCPVVYRVRGSRTPEETKLSAKADWLFGVLRVRYAYPEPGKLTVKILWKTVFDSSVKKQSSKETADAEKKTPQAEKEAAPSGKAAGEEKSKETENKEAESKKAENEEAKSKTAENKEAKDKEARKAAEPKTAEKQREYAGNPAAKEAKSKETEEKSAAEKLPDQEKDSAKDIQDGAGEEQKSNIWGKFLKLKYTIRKLCDKIKEIWENISYYAQLLQEDNTVKLWGHVRLRLSKIFKNIRPRHIRAKILFGAASPDTTGYLYGAFWMFSPLLGADVSVTPDFTQAVLQGEADISGHITGVVLMWNGLRLLLDRKLHKFIKMMKAGRKQDGR
ncbi:MAG: DUF2953 domain-containing protein [bacterium]|nr:DUF2953 domain-containing protein [bacterium]